MQATPLGYDTTRRALALGRSAFFGDTEIDLPMDRSSLLRKDDLTPQFGYIGGRYLETRVLLFGINPGNGPGKEKRSKTDERMMPALIHFAENPSIEQFAKAQIAYRSECESWPVWRRHCQEVVGAGKLSLDEIAYSNCLPWRSGSNSAFSDSVARNAANLYAYPLIDELQPSLIVAMGKRVTQILQLADKRLPRLVTWNRAQAATKAVLQDRANAALEIFSILGRGQ
jgi:hypothetical protein